MNFKKNFYIITFMLISSLSVFAANTTISKNGIVFAVSYNEKVNPGDAIFIKLKIDGKIKKAKTIEPIAFVEFHSEEKRLEKSNFYYLSSKKKNEMLSGIPISSFLHTGKFTLEITCQGFSEQDISFNLPVEVIEKEFDEYRLPISDDMTSLRTDTSPKRVSESELLNDTLSKITITDVYQYNQFVSPVKSTRRTSPFAQRRLYVYPSGKTSTGLHCGVDYGVPTGTEVSSCGAGKVVLAASRIVTGYSVVIEHLPGLYSIYYHMSALKVKEGQMVKQGDLIGLSGSTGFATGPHLHFEIRLNSICVNPDFFFSDFAFTEEK